MSRPNNSRSMGVLIGVLAVILVVLLVVAFVVLPGSKPQETTPSSQPTEPTQPSTAPTEPTRPTEPTVPTEPPIVKENTVTIGATGDILFHDQLIASGKDAATGTYDYSYIFRHLASYVGAFDYAVANMEGTMAGGDYVYPSGKVGYYGYPQFNAPDAVAVALRDAGFDMLLTANNHSYDTYNIGFHRTQQVIKELGLDYIGTKPDTQTLDYLVKDVGGIKIGMSCYTYNTGVNGGKVSLNGIPVSETDSLLINTFNPWQLDSFYAKLEQEIAGMKAAGADTIMLFIHWGDEYITTPNNTQKKIAQKLCDLGVDVIVGGHPHVMQPLEMLTSSVDPNKHTLCLYSMGNAVSNIFESSFPAECRDGMLFSVTFAKYSDGTVILESADVLPYYVNRHYDDTLNRYIHPIIPLDKPQSEWKSAYGLNDTMFAACQASLERTQAIIDEGLAAANAFLSQQQAQIEAQLGITTN